MYPLVYVTAYVPIVSYVWRIIPRTWELVSRMYEYYEYSKGVFGTVRTEAYRQYIPPLLPVPDTSVSSVRHQKRYRTLR